MLKRVFISMFAAAGLVAAPYASAEMQGYISGGLGFNAVNGDVVFLGLPGGAGGGVVGPTPPPVNTTSGKSNLTGQIEGGVRFPYSDNIIIGLGLYINPLSLDADSINNIPDAFSMTTKIKDLKGFVGEIGWKLGPSTVAYGKLTLNQARSESAATLNAVPSNLTANFSGVGFGAGFRQTLADNMYLFGEWHHIDGSEVSITIFDHGTYRIKPQLTTGLVGAGLTF